MTDTEGTWLDDADRIRKRLTRESFRLLNRVVVPAVKAGIGAPPPIVGPGILILETTGEKSGLPREVPLLGFRLGNSAVVSTVRGDSQWVRNLQADPEATVRLDGKERAVTATVNEGPLTIVELEPTPDD